METKRTSTSRKVSTDRSGLQKIQKFQKSTELLLRKTPFARLVRDVLHRQMPDARMSATSAEIMQEATEAYLVGLLEDANLLAIHGNRKTVSPKDIVLAHMLRDD